MKKMVAIMLVLVLALAGTAALASVDLHTCLSTLGIYLGEKDVEDSLFRAAVSATSDPVSGVYLYCADNYVFVESYDGTTIREYALSDDDSGDFDPYVYSAALLLTIEENVDIPSYYVYWFVAPDNEFQACYYKYLTDTSEKGMFNDFNEFYTYILLKG